MSDHLISNLDNIFPLVSGFSANHGKPWEVNAPTLAAEKISYLDIKACVMHAAVKVGSWRNGQP